MKDCIFCKIIKGELPSYKIFENDQVYAFLDIYPATNGHVLVIPKRHCSRFSELTDDEVAELAIISKKVLNAILNSEILSQGANIAMSQEKVAGQEVFHFHWHIIPRYDKDFLGSAFDRSKGIQNPEELSTIVDKIKSYIS